MKTSGNRILITGGSSGIGFELARRALELGNEVMVCGRSEGKLETTRERLAGVRTLACDVSDHRARGRLLDWATSTLPGVNILVNNAGIQREVDFTTPMPLGAEAGEIETNFAAAVHLCALFVPEFLAREHRCAVVNVTSGLGFIPLAATPIYCATKAGLHSFSMSLRSQLADTNVRVFEIIPPIVKTDLHREELARRVAEEQGISPVRVAEETWRALEKDRFEAAIGRARDLRLAARLAPHFFHRMLNKLAD